MTPAEKVKQLQDRLRGGLCIECGEPFTDKNVHTADGWRETRLSNMCEDCFDEVTAEPDEDECHHENSE